VTAIVAVVGVFAPPAVSTPTPLDDTNPLSTPFEVTNSIVVPLFRVSYSCEVLEARASGLNMKDYADERLANQKGVLWVGETMTANCHLPVQVRGYMNWKALRICLRLSYLPFRPAFWARKYNFGAYLSDDGQFLGWVRE
jgi:hypothetical protein